MSEDGVSNGRRWFLIGTTAALGGVVGAGVAIPFAASWTPSARARAAGAPVEVSLKKLEPGQLIRVKWRGQPVWILHRTESALSTLQQLTGELRDPQSEKDQQPEYCQNESRSLKEKYLVVVGSCTHLGCSPTYRPDAGAADLGTDWLGGFYCPCHGSKFDLAGRVYKGVPAPTNLPIPPHKYLDDETLLIGVDTEAA